MKENFNLQTFIDEWNIAFDIREEILESKTFAESERIFNANSLHPLILYGRLDYALINKNKMIVQDSMNKVSAFIYKPFPNHFFDLHSNDPIGEVMLKPLIPYPLSISPFNDSNVQDCLNWILIGYAFLFNSFKKQGLKAFDSLETMGASIEQNSDDFAFLIFGHYLGIQNYSEAYCKFLVFTFFMSGLGFHKYGNNDSKFLSPILDDLRTPKNHKFLCLPPEMKGKLTQMMNDGDFKNNVAKYSGVADNFTVTIKCSFKVILICQR